MKHTGFRNSMFLIALIILVASIGIYVYLYKATSDEVAKTLTSRNILRNTQSARLQGNQTLDLLSTTADKRMRSTTYFVPADNAVAVIQAIESIGKQSGATVTISSINATNPDDTTHVGRVSASVGINGTWKDVLEAIALFETLPYDRSMNQLNLHLADKTADSKDSSHWQADFNLSVATLK